MDEVPFAHGASQETRQILRCEGALECEALPALPERPHTADHDPTSGDRSRRGCKWREPLSDQICVYELVHAKAVGDKNRSNRRGV